MPFQRPTRNLRKLLVIEDDARLLASYRDLLTPYGFHILTASDGSEAMPLVEENPDILLVLLDIRMPGMDGRQWLRWYRSKGSKCPVIIISGYEFTDEDGSLFPSAVLAKPFDVAELLDLVGLFCGLGTPVTSFRM